MGFTRTEKLPEIHYRYKSKHFSCFFSIINHDDKRYEIITSLAYIDITPPTINDNGKSKTYRFISTRKFPSYKTEEEARDKVIYEAQRYVENKILPNYLKDVSEMVGFCKSEYTT